jgi:hypothetical protein
MGFNKRKMEDRRRQAAEQEAAARRATEKQILEDADYLIAVRNERRAKRMPMLFSPTIAPPSRPAFGCCGRAARPAAPPATSTDLRKLDRSAAMTALSPGAVVPILPTECAVRQTRPPVQVERCRGVLRGAQRQ